MLKKHPLVRTLVELRGNPRACVYTEPLWGIPNNLFAPYASLYMYALGVTDKQIGLIASIGMVFQILFSLLGGVITDKLGRKRTTFIFDFICWSIPCFIWAISQNFTYFFVAAIFHSVFRISSISWGSLLVEDCDKNQIVSIHTWIYIFTQGTSFIAPLAGLFIAAYGLVPAVRGFYVLSFIMMSAKFILTNKYSTETKQGKIRMEETKHTSINQMLKGYGPVFVQILKTPETLLTVGLMLIMSIINMINSTFWPLLVTENLKISENTIGIFPFVRSSIMLLFFFIVVPKLNAFRFKKPMLLGFLIFAISQTLLLITPVNGYLILVLSIIIEACSLSLINPLLDSLQLIMIDPQERARIIAILFVIVIAFTSPFGWIAGNLSSINRNLPFIMNLALLGCGMLLTFFAAIVSKKKNVEQVQA